MPIELIFAGLLLVGVALLVVIFLRGRAEKNKMPPLPEIDPDYDPVADLVSPVRVIPADEFEVGVGAEGFSAADDAEPVVVAPQADLFETQAEMSIGEAIHANAEEPEPVVVGAAKNLGESAPKSPPKKVVIFHITRRSGEMIGGTHIRRAAISAGLILDSEGFFTRRNDNRQTLYRMANMVKPGTFDAAHFEDVNTPGVTLFMALPDRFEMVQAFDDMLNTAGNLAASLDAVVLDENRVLLNEQSARFERDQVIAIAKDTPSYS
ncbi:MAG: cell division protein ZipA [Gammaproteobacteria bacterium]|jgi:cell division protein ZipA